MTGQERLDLLGITPSNSTLRVRKNSNDFGSDMSLFSVAENGDILIEYVDLFGNCENYLRYGKEVRYVVKRLAEPIGERKYHRPAGASIRPYITPGLIEKYRLGQHINTLYVVEGEFKAFKGYLEGLDILAIPGIHSIRDKERGKIFVEFEMLIEKCSVRRVAIVFDGDLRQLARDRSKDLFTRPNSFFTAVRNLLKGLRNFEGTVDFFLVHPLEGTEDSPKPKGLDDVYVAYPEERGGITAELLALDTGEGKYFKAQSISTWAESKLRNYWSIGSPDAFAKAYRTQLEGTEWVYKGSHYCFDEDGSLKIRRHADTSRFIRVGVVWYKEIEVPDIDGNINVRLERWTPAEIQRDYVYTKEAPTILQDAEKYDAFANVPCNTDEYQRSYLTPSGKCYNLYHPCLIEPERGEWPTIETYLRHLFQNEYQDHLDIAYDYFTLLHRSPTQMLPILCLVSPERETGKSTLFDLERIIWGANVRKIESDALTGRFTNDWAAKLILFIDEGFIHKREALLRIMSLSTSNRASVEGKFAERSELDFFGKFQITTNEMEDFLRISDEEVRFWIVRVPKLRRIDPDMRFRMEEEAPAFVHFLSNRELRHPKRTRHWFDHDLLKTDTRTQVVQAAASYEEKDVRAMISELFFSLRSSVLEMPVSDMKNLLITNNRIPLRHHKAQEILTKMGLVQKNGTYTYRELVVNQYGETVSEEQRRGRYYRLDAEKLLPVGRRAELEEFLRQDAAVQKEPIKPKVKETLPEMGPAPW